MSKPKISKKVHNAFVKEYMYYEKRYDYNAAQKVKAIEEEYEVLVNYYDAYCRMYVSRIDALKRLYKKLTGERLEEQSIR